MNGPRHLSYASLEWGLRKCGFVGLCVIVRGVLCGEHGTGVDSSWGLLPDADDGLVRGDLVRAGDWLGGCVI